MISVKKNFLKLFLFLAALGLYGCAQAFSSCNDLRLLTVAASRFRAQALAAWASVAVCASS